MNAETDTTSSPKSRPSPNVVAALIVLVAAVGLAVVILRPSPPDKGKSTPPPPPTAETYELVISRPESATVFGLCELQVQFPDKLAAFNQVPTNQLHDAYDADRNGVFMDLSAEFSHETGRKMVVPGFAMRDRVDGLWSWRIRWSPDRPGDWRAKILFRGRGAWSGDAIEITQDLPDTIRAEVGKGLAGPLVMPGKDQNQSYLRELRPDGSSKALWLFGACRAWVVDPKGQHPDWKPNEWIDRDKELFPALRDGGFNLLNQWMAPWEYLLIHHDRAEFWQQGDGSWKRVALPNQVAWSSFQSIDQGRALAFDRLVTACEGETRDDIVRLLLSPLPHQCFQTAAHPWGVQESGFSPEDDRGRQSFDRLNGLSGFRPGMWVWDFFEADPRLPLADWRSQLFDHQANFFRYIIARWGYSSAIGSWVLIDELDGIGDEMGVMKEKTGWWRHPQCERWLGDMVRMFRDRLSRSDGCKYLGDPFRHPLHAATTSSGGQASRGGNLDWPGGPKDSRIEVAGWHWYPDSAGEDDTWFDFWLYVIDGIASYAGAPIDQPTRLISEFGAMDRYAPDNKPFPLYPTLYHHALWAGVFTGLAGTPMDWDDGKEFGEIRWRKRPGIFSKDQYPIDHTAQMRALQRFLKGLSPDRLNSTMRPDSKVKCVTSETTRAFALVLDNASPSVFGWCFVADRKNASLSLSGLTPGSYRLELYDPWTGNPIPNLPTDLVDVDKAGTLVVKMTDILKRLPSVATASRSTVGAVDAKSRPAPPRRRRRPATRPAPAATGPVFPTTARLHRGHDFAFKLVPADQP